VHRFTGILLSAGFLILVFWLVAAASGPERYAQALSCLASLPMQLVLASVLWSYCYHFLNGIRHLCWDLGLGFELATARASGWTVAVASVVLAGILWFVLQRSLGGAA
jgi:succinate dehydrogenase / fumarate reductase cytochrome b subunit